MLALFSILSLFSWVLIASVILFLIQIARFYERKYSELYDDAPTHRTFYPFFLISLCLFLIAAGRYAFLGDLAGDVWGDVALFLGGIVLAVFAHRLQRLMTGGPR
jgi:hypothetical protein